MASNTVPNGKSGPGYCISVIKRLDEGVWKQLLEQKPRLRIYNGWQKLNSGGPGPLVVIVKILLVVTVQRKKC